MQSIQRGLVLLTAIGAVTLAGATERAPRRVGNLTTQPSHAYTKSQVEYYLTEEETTYVRPGLTVEIADIDIPADRHPVVEVTFVDDMGLPLDRAGRLTPGDISISFILAWYDGGLRRYTAYTIREQTDSTTGATLYNGSSDRGGSWEDLETGRARYTFGTQLPADFDMSRTHTIAVYARRNTEDIVGKYYYSNVLFDFRPDGGAVTEQWAAIATSTCNECHDPLALHGSRRREVKMCVLCHNPQSADPDTGNTVDFKVMIHKIHRGANLPSVEAGGSYRIGSHDYSEVEFPQDIRNCTKCHRPEAPEGYIWYTLPSRAVCGSCHDDIDWETGEGHDGGIAQETDELCSVCHIPQGDREFDRSIMGAHTIPTKSMQLAGINMEITDVTNVAPGDTPTVYFALTNGDGSMVDDIAGLRTLTLRAAGPTGQTIDHTVDLSVDARDAATAGDVYMKTFSSPLPDDATGTWAFSADVRRASVIEDGSEEGLSVTEGAFNPVFYAEVTAVAKAAVARRKIVDIDKCNRCHDALSLHGGQRFNVEECVFCHRPNNNDADERPAEAAPPESIDFRWMVHRIHTGHELATDFTVYGHNGSVNNYNETHFPGDRRNCEGCHDEDTYLVPLPEGAANVDTMRDWYTPKRPAAASCLACHSSVDAAAHAFVNTAPFGEACASCHGEDREFSVTRVHAR